MSFTGSVKTGRNIAVDCAKLGKKSQLEMGGKNPLVVLDDTDLLVDANLDTAVSFSERRVVFFTGSTLHCLQPPYLD